MIGIGKIGFELAIPFETGGMDTSGFTVASGMPQGRRERPTDDAPGRRWAGYLAIGFWMAASTLVG